MPDPLSCIRPSVREIKPYAMTEVDYQTKLNQNENPFDLPDSLKNEILTRFTRLAWNRYPSFTTETLRTKIAEKEGVAPEMVLIGNGSNELLQLVCAILLGPGQSLLLAQPTFQLYAQLGRVLGAEIVNLDLNADFSFPVEKILSANRQQAFPLQIFCSPNNPTGSVLSLDEIIAILKMARGIVAIDEAYFDFHGVSALSLLPQFPNLVLTRTFSKAFGLAGLRLGYLIAPAPLATEIYKAKLPYNLNLFSELTALTLLDHPELVQTRIQQILQQRDELIRSLRELPELTVYPTHANFFLLQTPLAPSALFDQLLADGILVRNVSKNHPLLADKLRVSVGSPAENARLVQSLRRILAKTD